MLMPIHSLAQGKLRVLGYASGSGNTLWKTYELQKQMEASPEGCPFEIVGVFADSVTGKCVETAKQLGIPYKAIDIRQYYKDRNKPLRDREVRAEYDKEALDLVRGWDADIILLAGYVWATTDQVLDEYLVVNVHPADLRIMKDGKRAYAGANGVGGTLDAREATIAASSHLATKQIDGGPLLMVSESVPVDYSLHTDDETRMRHYLKLVNDQNRMVGARTILEIAMGNYQVDENGAVYHKGEIAPDGLKIENWNENKPIFERRTRTLLHPGAVAVIGASQKPGIGKAVVSNLLRDKFDGPVFAVNMRGEDVGAAKGFKSVLDIPGEVDLAVITVPSGAVLKVAEECGQKEVSALVCITAGFKEVGGEGVAAQEELLKIVNKHNMRMVGPNCMGLLNAGANLNATMLSNAIEPGHVALITQSGAIGAAMLDYAKDLGIGFSSIVSLGNQADVNVCDLLPLLEEDENTKVIVMYLETLYDPARFWKYVAKMETPVVVLKSGATAAGATAASSHTGSLAGNDAIVSALIEKVGILRVETIEECFMAAVALSHMPRLEGKRVCLLTNAGGPGILISDALSKSGFAMPQPSAKLREYLAANLMKEASPNNPIDVVASAAPEHYVLAAKAVLDSGEYDALVVCCVPPATVDTAEVAQALIPTLKSASIPVVTNFFGPTLGGQASAIMREAGIPSSEYPEQTAVMLRSLNKRPVFAGDEAAGINTQTLQRAREVFSTHSSGEYLQVTEVYGILESIGLTVPKCALITDPSQVSSIDFAYPVVAKIEHPEIVHKSDVGGVKLGLTDAAELEVVVRDFLSRFQGASGVFVQEMVPAGTEIIVGAATDGQMGQAIMVGLGGVWVEIMKDIKFGYLPLNQDGAMHMINSLKIEPLLEGYRGKTGVNKEKLAEMLLKMGSFLLALPEIAELDMNPVIYDEKRDTFVVVDARLRLG